MEWWKEHLYGHGKITRRQELWCEAAQTATLLDNILVQDSANVET